MIDPHGRYSHPAEDGQAPRLLFVPEGDADDHLSDVVDRVRKIVPEDATTPDGRPLRPFVVILAYAHDIGKLTTWFQSHLADESVKDPTHHAPLGGVLAEYLLEAEGYSRTDRTVGFVAVASHHRQLPNVLDYVVNRTSPQQRNEKKRWRGDLPKQVENIEENEVAAKLARQIVRTASDNGSWEEFVQKMRRASDHESDEYDGGGRLDVVHELIREEAAIGTGFHDRPLDDSAYVGLLRTWSSLVLADKTSAARGPVDPEGARELTWGEVDEHIKDLPEDEDSRSPAEKDLDDERESARKAALDGVKRVRETDPDVVTLTLPTGLGKTMTGLSAAIRLARDSPTDDGGRIVYALPFTSIIDQVVDEMEDIFEDDPLKTALVVHHHLAETAIAVEGEEVDDEWEPTDPGGASEYTRTETMLGESWRGDLTVTTFVQLFESLAGPANTQSMKLPALHGSVVIVDEPQALPFDWWPLARRLIEILVTEFDATVLTMTATQPGLFAGSDLDVEPLIPDERSADRRQRSTSDAERDGPTVGEFFENRDRVQFELHDSVLRAGRRLTTKDGTNADEVAPLEYDEAARELVESVSDAGSTLAVCNTIDSAIELTETVEERLPETAVNVNEEYASVLDEQSPDPGSDSGRIVDMVVKSVKASGDSVATIHLTTRLRPRDRLELVETAEALVESDVPVLLVSTQLIEAGVDISFQRVYRDFAPMDSIVQAAGRCNRSHSGAQGNVTVWWLSPPPGTDTDPSRAVYNRSIGDGNARPLLNHTWSVLDEFRDERSLDTGPSPVFDETTITRDAVVEYYRSIRDGGPVGQTEYVDLVEEARCRDLGEISLIDDRQSVDVVVARTDSDHQLVEEIRKSRKNFEYERLRHLLERTKSLRVSVPAYQGSDEVDRLRELDDLDSKRGIKVLDLHGRHSGTSKFDETTGLVLESSIDDRFL